MLYCRMTSYFFLDHLARAAFVAMLRRVAWDSLDARARPPKRPSATAARLLPSSVWPDSSISPVAIFMTVTALPMTSAGRLWPFGVRDMLSDKHNTVSVGLCR